MGAYYIYALKDPTSNPAKPFYIGKGTGTRAYDHLAAPDQTRKGRRIAEITGMGHEPVVSILASDLTELQALRLEAELISAFGVEANGGLLTNSVSPTGGMRTATPTVVIPSGTRERAEIGLSFLKEAVLELAKANPNGIRNSDASKALGLQSDYGGGSKDYLAFSILGVLLREGKLVRDESKGRGRHVARVR